MNCSLSNAHLFDAEEPATEAKTICATCPDRMNCLVQALEDDEPQGVWGGATRRERKRIKRSQNTFAAIYQHFERLDDVLAGKSRHAVYCREWRARRVNA